MSNNPWNDDPDMRVRQPMKSVDENPDVPLILDLPDGQKLVVGELPEGTVIEVAAWHGTGKPDNRTVRLLLGVSHKKVQQEEDPVETDSGEVITPPPSRQQLRAQKRRRRAWLISLGVVVLLAIAGIALYLSPLKFIHPTEGASVGFGPAHSAIAVTLPADNYEQGQTLVGTLPNGETVIGRVVATSVGEVLLQTDKGYAQIADDNIEGSTVMVIPFIGYLF